MEERCKHKITSRCVIEEKTKELGENPLCGPPSRIDPLVNKVGVQYIKKTLSILIYPKYLNPLSSSYQRASSSHISISYSNLKISSKLYLSFNGFFQ